MLDFSYHVKTHWAPLLEYSATMRFANIGVNDYICFQHLGNTQFTFALQILKKQRARIIYCELHSLILVVAYGFTSFIA